MICKDFFFAGYLGGGKRVFSSGNVYEMQTAASGMEF